MPFLRLTSPVTGDVFNLNSVAETGYGVEALAGAAGLGLPAVSVQWLSGAGDGATFRGQRVQARTLVLDLYFRAPNRSELKAMLAKASRMLVGAMRLEFVDADGTSWYLDVHRVGGGDYDYGVDTLGETDLVTTVTLQAGDPYWQSTDEVRYVVGAANTGRGLLKAPVAGVKNFGKLRVSGTTASGAVTIVNDGDVAAYPTWTIVGPGTSLLCVGPTGEQFEWTGTLEAGDTLTIDSRQATIKDGSGASRYSELSAAPRFWTIPPGTSVATVLMTGAEGNEPVSFTFKKRKWGIV